MTQKHFAALLAPKGVSISNTESIQTDGKSQDACELPEVNPSAIHLIPYDDANWTSLMESVEEWGRREEI